MPFILNSSTPRKNNYSLTTNSTANLREWWAAECKRVGTDWHGLFDLHVTIVNRLQAASSSWCSS
jgi:hypothetical protein